MSWSGKAMERSLFPRLLLCVFLGALGIRLLVTHLFVGLNAEPDASAATDQIQYEDLAYRLASGDGYTLPSGEPTALRPPGTSFLLAPVYLTFGRNRAAARIWFCLLSSATCVVVAWATRQFASAATALLAAGWLAVYPGHFYYSMHFLSEVPFALWLALAAGSVVRSRASRPALWAAVSGAALGAAILTRPQAASMLPLTWLAVVLARPLRTRTGMSFVVIQAVVAALVVGPWVARNHRVMGKATLSTIGGYTFWGAHNETVVADPQTRGSWIPLDGLSAVEAGSEADETEREAHAWQRGLDYVRQNPGELPGLLGMKLWRLVSPFSSTSNKAVYWSFAVAWCVTGPLMAWGLMLLFRRQKLAALTVSIPVLATILTALVFYGSVRFRESIAPILVMPAAYALVEGLRRGSLLLPRSGER